MSERVTARCRVTGVECEVRPLADGSPALAPGWKRLGEDYYSPDGWAERFVLRSVHLPVASVARGYDGCDWSPDACREAWKAFRRALKLSGQQARAVLNWLLVEYACSDRGPLEPGPKGPKLPKWSPPDNKSLYALARRQWPDLDSQAVSALIQKAKAAYKAKRFDRRVLGRATLPEFTAGEVPVPVQAKDSPVAVSAEGQPFVKLRLAGERFTLRLRNGREFGRQLAALGTVLRGEGVRGELSLFERRTWDANADNGGRATATGGRRFVSRVVAAFALHLPKRPGDREGEILVKTCPDRLWQVWVNGREQPWNLNDDQVRAAVVGHRARLQRLREDHKMERRRPRLAGRGLREVRERACARQNNRLADYCHKASAILAGLARRHRAAAVVYDDAETAFMPAFPWFKLRSLCEQKLNAIGVTFLRQGGTDEADEAAVLE